MLKCDGEKILFWMITYSKIKTQVENDIEHFTGQLLSMLSIFL